jgi:N-acyl homoserine lactone hydrolase
MKGKTGNWVIRPIPMIYGPMLQAKMLNQWFWSDYITDAFYCWLLENGDKKILVDTGLDLAENHAMKNQPKEIYQELIEGLAKLGVQPDDIDTVLETHLDRDHCGFIHDFKKAKFIVQKAELEVAMNPHPMNRTRNFSKAYYSDINWQIVEGDYQVCDGVNLLFTPGHTPGTQSVAVDTPKGCAIICGMCCLDQNFYPPAEVLKLQEVIPTTIVYNAMQDYDSMLRIKKEADIVVTSHSTRWMFVDKIGV